MDEEPGDDAEGVVDTGDAADDLIEGGPTQAGFDRSETAVAPPVRAPEARTAS